MILSMRGQEYDYEFQESEVPVISQLKQEDIDQFQRDNNDSSSSSEESQYVTDSYQSEKISSLHKSTPITMNHSKVPV
jgi:hypothetical protein